KGSCGLPWIDDLDTAIRKIIDIARYDSETARPRDGGDLRVEFADASACRSSPNHDLHEMLGLRRAEWENRGSQAMIVEPRNSRRQAILSASRRHQFDAQ